MQMVEFGAGVLIAAPSINPECTLDSFERGAVVSGRNIQTRTNGSTIIDHT